MQPTTNRILVKEIKTSMREVVQSHATEVLNWISIILIILQINGGDSAKLDKLKDIAYVAGAIAAQVSKKRQTP